MNTAFPVTPVAPHHPAAVGPHVRRFHERLARRLGAALVAWSRQAEKARADRLARARAMAPTREELAALHELRMEGARLRDQARTGALASHLF